VLGDRPSAPGGIYVFERWALEMVPKTGFQDIKQGLIERLYAAGERVVQHQVQGITPRVLDYHSYLRINRWLVERSVSDAIAGYERVDGYLRHYTAAVHPSAKIVGPVLIGADVAIGKDVVVIGPASIGFDSTIEHSAVVSRAVIWDQCAVGAFSNIDASILTSRSIVSPHGDVYGSVERGAPHQLLRGPGDKITPLWHLPLLPKDLLRADPLHPASDPVIVPDRSHLLRA
jgi:NDP-sugar pyrophosphorylase family protein